MRSSTKPITKADKKLSVKHLKDSMAYNSKHIKDHKNLEKKGGSKKYNEDHIKEHKKQLKKDKKLLEKRKKRLSPNKAKKLLTDNSAQGHPLTSKQKKLFQAVAHGFKMKRGTDPQATPYFQDTSAQSTRSPSGQINPFKAKRKLIRAMRGYKR